MHAALRSAQCGHWLETCALAAASRSGRAARTCAPRAAALAPRHRVKLRRSRARNAAAHGALRSRSLPCVGVRAAGPCAIAAHGARTCTYMGPAEAPPSPRVRDTGRSWTTVASHTAVPRTNSMTSQISGWAGFKLPVAASTAYCAAPIRGGLYRDCSGNTQQQQPSCCRRTWWQPPRVMTQPRSRDPGPNPSLKTRARHDAGHADSPTEDPAAAAAPQPA
jgi:hypothetical protein